MAAFEPHPSPPKRFQEAPLFLRVLPFFLSALLFLSAFFTVFSPLPLLILGVHMGAPVLLAAALTNSLIVVGLGGLLSGGLYGVFGIASALGIYFFFVVKKFSFVRSLLLTLGLMLLGSGVLVAGVILVSGAHPIDTFRSYIGHLVDQFDLLKRQQGQTGYMTRKELVHNVMAEFPSTVILGSVVLVWANLILLLRFNPKKIKQKLGVSKEFFEEWKSPEWLVWPTLASGSFLLIEIPEYAWVSEVGFNLFKVFLCIYAFQGLSVLLKLVEHWKIQGLFRSLLFAGVVLFMMPFLVGLGFFDLWFDFRKKLVQS